MIFFFSFLWFLALGVCITETRAESDYHESLLLRPLPESSLLASFSFRSNATASSFEQQNFRFFPRSLGQILHHTNTKELHLRFSTGRWDEEIWGARPRWGSREGGTGVELWAWVEADTVEEADKRWLTVTNALSGLFCASLNFIDSTRTIRPVMTFQPEGHHSQAALSTLHLLHGTLPREVVCTENLTPFLKLLPCKGKAGVSSLLDGHKLFDASWQSMAIDVRPVCPAESTDCLLEMEQSIDMVLDIERSKRPRDDPIPRPVPLEAIDCDQSKPYNGYGDSCYPAPRPSLPGFSLEEVFGRPLKGSCPLAENYESDGESVCLDVAPERQVQVNTTGKYYSRKLSEFRTCYKMPVGVNFDLTIPEQKSAFNVALEEPLLLAERTFSGHGQEKGGVNVVINNPTSRPIEFVYLESLPWFMKPYIHTLQGTMKTLGNVARSMPRAELLKHMHYRPAVDRHRGSQLELILSLPPHATLTMTYDFEKAILRYTEYPPDANRGFDAAPAVIRVLNPPLSSENPSSLLYIRTTSLLLYLPTPDFSMPYNVIILTSTVIALGFGSIFNLLVRRFVGADEADGYDAGILKTLISRRIGMLRSRFFGKGKKDE